MHEKFTWTMLSCSYLVLYCVLALKKWLSWSRNCICLSCTIWWIFIICNTCENHNHSQHTKYFHHSPKIPCAFCSLIFALRLVPDNHWYYFVFSRILYKLNHMLCFCVWCFALSTVIVRFILVVECVSSWFLLLRNSTAFCWSSHQFMGTWIVPILGLL